MGDSTAMLGVWMEMPPEHEDDLNRWYEEEHLLDRLAMPGWLRGRRYVSVMGEPKYFAMYDVTDLGAFRSPEYTHNRNNPTPWTEQVTSKLTTNIRREYELLQTTGSSPDGGAPFALIVQLETDEEHDAELNRWYEEEHLAALVGLPGVYGARRYRATEGSPRYLMIYEAENREVIRNDEWQRAAATPWTLKMRPHFRNRRDNIVRLISSKTG
jgi:hypothetical protein